MRCFRVVCTELLADLAVDLVSVQIKTLLHVKSREHLPQIRSKNAMANDKVQFLQIARRSIVEQCIVPIANLAALQLLHHIVV